MGSITVHLEEKSSEALSHEIAREELLHLEKDIQNYSNDKEGNNKDLVEVAAKFLNRADPVLRVAAAVCIHQISNIERELNSSF